MVTLQVPFETAEEHGVTLDVDLPDENLVASFVPDEPRALPDAAARIRDAVEHPAEGKPLSEIVRRGDKVTIITENQFRAAPFPELVPPILDLIRAAGGEPSIIVGCGKAPGDAEATLGAEIVSSGVPIAVNDVTQEDDYRLVGMTTRGIPLFIHRFVADADVKISVSTTQATLWGYGGSGMIQPAVSGNETVEMSHVLTLPNDCRPGNNDCQLQQDKYEAARIAGIDMGVHCIVSNRDEVTYIGAGDFVEAHKRAIAVYDRTYRFDARRFAGAPADIVITGSSTPTNHLFFHTGWAVVNCDPIVKEGGTVIQATPCPGFGDFPGFVLMDLMAEYLPPSPEHKAKAMRAFYSRDRELWAGCIWWKIYEVMTRKHVSIVTNSENLDMTKEIGLEATDSLETALKEAFNRHGSNAQVVFAPYGRYSVFEV